MIRKYEDRDLEEVLDVWYQASIIAHSFLTDEFFEQERENIRNIYMPNADSWVYVDEGRVVGFISLADNEVGGIFIYPECQGRGIGQALMNKARELHRALELEVYKDNLKARRFYERYGFVAFKEYLFEDTGQLMVRMRLED